MNPEVKEKWVAALRSGKYQQGRGVLRTPEDSFCSLGVLCDLAAQVGVGQWADFGYSTATDFCEGSLPEEVRVWAGLTDRNPQVGTHLPKENIFRPDVGLLALNDIHHFSFERIADLIEEQL